MFCLLCVKDLFEGLKLTENKMVISSLPSSFVRLHTMRVFFFVTQYFH